MFFLKKIMNIIYTWLCAILSQNIKKDNEARTLFRKKLPALRNKLEELSLQISNPFRRNADDAKKIKEIQSIIRELRHADFFVEIPSLMQLIAKSEKLIARYTSDPHNPVNYIHFIAVELLHLWGNGWGKDYDAKKITELRYFVDLGLAKRVYYIWIKPFFIERKKMIKVFVRLFFYNHI